MSAFQRMFLSPAQRSLRERARLASASSTDSATARTSTEFPRQHEASTAAGASTAAESSAQSAAKKRTATAMIGAAFLMATSAIGPGFLTQTAIFTEKLGANFAIVILASIILDIIAQANVWRVIILSGKRAQDIANIVLPGLGNVLTVVIVFGGIAFNVGNIAGAGLGMNAFLKVSVTEGAINSAVLAIAIFLVKEAGQAMDKFAQWLGLMMIALTLYVAFQSSPPLLLAAEKLVLPDKFDLLALVTIVGGTVGGYITFAGGHRLLDAGVSGAENLPQTTRSAAIGILVASSMRILLFIAALGVVAAGVKLYEANPPSSVFYNAAGAVGVQLFGVVMWAAAITSIVGSAYTSVTFLQSLSGWVAQRRRTTIVLFIVFSMLVFLTIGRPVKVLLYAGMINGFILPLSLGVMLLAAHRPEIVGSYKQPWWLTALGLIVVVVMFGSSIYTITR
jgi:Mn2+/Fe2+ NRAMP family transporter